MAQSAIKVRRLFWPQTAAPVAKVTTVAEAVLAVAAVVAGLLGFLGWLPISSERAAQMVLALAGFVALALVVEAAERRQAMAGLDDTRYALVQLLGDAPIRQVAPDDIGQEITLMLAQSKDWLFRGGSARFLRGTTLPTLAANARTLQIPVLVALLDPRDLELCESYANYRSKIGRTDPTVSARSIQAEILSTIYLAGWYAVRKRLHPRVVLLRSFSQLRYDIGSTGLLVTVADRSKPALYASAESWYYRSLRDELEQMFHGNPAVELPPHVADYFPPSLGSVTADGVREALAHSPATDAPLLSSAAMSEQVDWDLVRNAVVSPYEPNT